jgi:hypothetical protein
MRDEVSVPPLHSSSESPLSELLEALLLPLGCRAKQVALRLYQSDALMLPAHSRPLSACGSINRPTTRAVIQLLNNALVLSMPSPHARPLSPLLICRPTHLCCPRTVGHSACGSVDQPTVCALLNLSTKAPPLSAVACAQWAGLCQWICRPTHQPCFPKPVNRCTAVALAMSHNDHHPYPVCRRNAG